MKRIVSLILAITLSSITMSTFAANKDEYGHTLVSLWKSYYSAIDKDKPKEQATILENIKKEALAKRLSWDYYDACNKYVEARLSTNWKLRDELNSQKFDEFRAYDEPIINFTVNGGSIASRLEYVQANKDRMQKAYNPEFYTIDSYFSGQVYSPALTPLVKNDYDFALWSIFLRSDRWSRTDDAGSLALKERYGDEYPYAAFIDYTFTRAGVSDGQVRQNLKDYAVAYNGRAVSLFVRQDLIQMDFKDLGNDRTSTGRDYEKIKAACEKFIADQKVFSNTEKSIADCCVKPRNLLETMASKDISFNISDDRLTVRVRNLPSVKFEIVEEKTILNKPVVQKTVHEKTLQNSANSYYVYDTLTYDLPPINDGSYLVRCSNGKTEAESGYEKYTLSIACRRDAEGVGVYVADYKTGKPVEKADITVTNTDNEVIGSVKGLAINGFTYLPKDLQEIYDKKSWGNRITASVRMDGIDLKSTDQRLYFNSPGSPSVPSQSAIILTDRSAFNPDETLHYKVILYNGSYDLKVMEGVRLNAILYDSEGDEIDKTGLTTGEFGSAAGEFVLKRRPRNGMYTLSIFTADNDKYPIVRKSVRVDDFVLPTFELTWEPVEKFYLPGDEITVKGKVKSYSGHSLSTAKCTYTVETYGRTYKLGDLQPAPDGSFEIRFPAIDDNFCHYSVSVKVSDATGETQEFETSAISLTDIPLSLTLRNSATGRFYTDTKVTGSYDSSNCRILSGDKAEVLFEIRECPAKVSLKHSSLKIRYEVKKGENVIMTDTATSGQTCSVDLSGKTSGLYTVVATATATDKKGKEHKRVETLNLLKVKDSDRNLENGVLNFFKETADEIGIQFGHTGAPVWAVAELYGTGNVLLEKKTLTLSGKDNLKTVAFDYKESYPDVVSLRIFYFMNGHYYDYNKVVYRKVNRLDLPLSFSRFLDTTKPGATYTFNIRTAAGVECAATIFDKSTETMSPNVWQSVQARRYPQPSVNYSASCGRNSSSGYYYGDRMGGVMMKSAATGAAVRNRAVMADAMAPSPEPVAEEAMMMEEVMAVGYAAKATDDALADEEMPTGYIRENFANTVAWEPFLKSDKDGNISFKFTNADKLSTYYVQLFAHQTDMHNATLRQEMVVTIPVKIALVEPRILYTGDKYILRTSLANSTAGPVSGRLTVTALDGGAVNASPTLNTRTKAVTVPAGGNADLEFPIDVPAIDTLGLKLVFEALGDFGSDGVFVSVPVHKAVQEITEAHSSILLAGQDRDALIANLRSQFVNIAGKDAGLKETSIIDMIREALPALRNYDSENAISLTEALYANSMISRIEGKSDWDSKEATEKLRACQNKDGGFGWFEGMDSSPMVTAVVLERFAAMRSLHNSVNIPAAVKYLDSCYLGKSGRPVWCGGISQGQYLYLRSLYPAVRLDTGAMGLLALRRFRKDNKEYLVPTKARGLNGMILAKARRLKTLRNLVTDPAGSDLAASLGISSGKKLEKSLLADIESLLEYAEPHKSGGTYYPNAVMPWRGLLESELYAHSLLCDLLSDCGHEKVADGIRLWIMVQKETQKWEDDPAYIEAIASVLNGSQDVLQTKVVILSATTTLPFADIKAAGNGFRLERRFYRDGKEISDGEVLNVGDKIIAKFSIWNEENRSFVRLTVPRNGALRPVEQLSGRLGWHLPLIHVVGWIPFGPQGYRNVLADRTEFWYESYPEENTTLEEAYFVTQAGTFQSPVPVIESLYAPHYRANGTSAVMLTE